MSQYVFRGNLSAARFPLISTFGGRTVIIPQYDQNFQKLAAFSGGDQDRDIGIPQIFYGHNIIPTSEGFQSVGYEQIVSPAVPAQTDFYKAFVIRDVDDNKGILVPSAGKNYIFTAVADVWNSVNPLAPGTFAESDLVTVTTLRGHTYHFYVRTGMYEYDFNTNVINSVALTGLVVGNIIGITSSSNYLIAWDDRTVYWSNVLNATDFVPSLATGAGSEIPSELKGIIVVILAAPGGFIIYTTRNAVFAAYTGNIRFPWLFKEIPGSAGVKEPNHVSWEANTGYHIAWTVAGLMKVERTGIELIYPEVTDFFAGRIFEDYNSSTGLLEQEYLETDLYLNLVLIDSRYLIISYGVSLNIYTHALYIDLALKRFGKLKIDHVDCFEWPAPNLYGITTYADLEGRTYDDLADTSYSALSSQQKTTVKTRRNIAFLQKDGAVKILDFDLGDFNDEAVAFFGKFQLTRNRLMTFHRLETENVDPTSNNFEVKVHTSYDGKNFGASYTPTLVSEAPNLKVHGGRFTGQNITVQYTGAFNLNTILLTTVNHGDR